VNDRERGSVKASCFDEETQRPRMTKTAFVRHSKTGPQKGGELTDYHFRQKNADNLPALRFPVKG